MLCTLDHEAGAFATTRTSAVFATLACVCASAVTSGCGARIGGYRGLDLFDPRSDRLPLGCTVLRDAHFWPEERWIPWQEAEGWRPNIVQGATVRDAALAARLIGAMEGDLAAGLRVERARWRPPPRRRRSRRSALASARHLVGELRHDPCGPRRCVAFRVLGGLLGVETIATGRQIHELRRLRKAYGGRRWRKRKALGKIELNNGAIRTAALHWYEAHRVGVREMKIKRLL